MTNQTQQFFDALYATKPESAFVLVWRLANKFSKWFTSLEAAAAYVAENAQDDLYVQIGISPEDFGPHGRCPAQKVIGIPALWIDFDVRGPAHQKTNLPRSAVEALSILPPELPPSMVVDSGHGLHAWWIFKEIELFEDDEDRQRAALVIRNWERHIRQRAAREGWTIDATHDLARILRIPGTMNNKLPDNRVEARILYLEDRRYNLSEFEDYAPLADDPAAAARQIAVPAVDMSGLVIAADRALDPEKLALLMEDKRFAETWRHKRDDMGGDNSQSAYDLAVGNILFEAGCSDQEIIDGLIQNRRERGKATKLRVDYYRRTLSKVRSKRRGGITAAEVLAGPIAAHAPTAAPAPEGQTPAEPPKREPLFKDEEKVKLYDRLSELLNLWYLPESETGDPVEPRRAIVRVVKVGGSKPIWRIELATGAIITLTNASHLFDQGRLRTAIYAATNRKLPKYKPDGWEAVIDVFTESIIEVDPGAEATDTGYFNLLTEQYLMASGVRGSEKEAFGDAKLLFMPFEVEGQIAISAIDLIEWAAKSRGTKKEMPEAVHTLSAMGATPRDFEVGPGRSKQVRWLLPARFKPEFWREAEKKSRIALPDEPEAEK